MTEEYKLTLRPITLDQADSRAREVLDQTKAQVGFIPNMYAGMANLPGLLETYLLGYARFRAESGFTPAEQEVVFLTISRENGCHYCMAAHSMLADKHSQVPMKVTDAIRDCKTIDDPRMSALFEFTRTMLRTRGLPLQEDVTAFLRAGFSERQVLAIILALAVKTLSNYSNHAFHTPVDEMFAYRAWTG